MLLRALKPLAVLCLAASPLAAQTLQPLPPYTLERLEIDPDGLGALAVGSGETLAPGALRAALAAEFEHNPLILMKAGSPDLAVVGERITTHASFAIGVFNRLELAAQLRFVPYQSGDDIAASGYQNPGSSALLPPTLTARVGLLRTDEGAPFNLAAHLALELQLGSRDSLGGSANPAYFTSLLASRRFGPVQASLDLGAALRRQTAIGGNREGAEAQGNFALSIGDTLRAELMARGGVSLTDSDKALELLGAVRLRAASWLELFAMGGPGYGQQPGTPKYRVMAGVAWTPSFGAPRSASPAAARRPQLVIARGPEVKPAPPPAPLPVIVAKPKGPCDEGEKHEPAQCPLLDDDHDGIANGIDACPLEAGPIETRGCPIKDTDGDGVPDHLDNCPKEPGPASNQGCPLQLKQLVVITKTKLEIKDKVYFASGKALLLPRSYPLLNQVAQVIKGHPELPPISIDGHTDSSGNAAQNKQLSQVRAETVRKYLIKQGVAADRLAAHGFGAERPIESNQTAGGRANNRRVEFNLAPRAADSGEPHDAAPAPASTPAAPETVPAPNPEVKP